MLRAPCPWRIPMPSPRQISRIRSRALWPTSPHKHRLAILRSEHEMVRPLSYAFEVATDAIFNANLLVREGVAPGDAGRTGLRLPDPLAHGPHLLLAGPCRGRRQHGTPFPGGQFQRLHAHRDRGAGASLAHPKCESRYAASGVHVQQRAPVRGRLGPSVTLSRFPTTTRSPSGLSPGRLPNSRTRRASTRRRMGRTASSCSGRCAPTTGRRRDPGR